VRIEGGVQRNLLFVAQFLADKTALLRNPYAGAAADHVPTGAYGLIGNAFAEGAAERLPAGAWNVERSNLAVFPYEAVVYQIRIAVRSCDIFRVTDAGGKGSLAGSGACAWGGNCGDRTIGVAN
jgi:hypothetical protein